MNARTGARPWLAYSQYDYAAMLLEPAAAGDRRKARSLVESALETAEALGMRSLAERSRALLETRLLEDVGDRTAEGSAQTGSRNANMPASSASANVFRREGEYWTIAFANVAIRLRDTKGLHYIAQLLAHPGRDIHAADLVTGGGEPADGRGRSREKTAEGDLGAVLDPRATAEYRRRLADLREELEEATRADDAGRAERARHEIELITHELSAAYGLGGRARRAGDPAERVRKAVTNQIRRALERIQADHPALGRHLANGLRTGFVCAYRPEHSIDWSV